MKILVIRILSQRVKIELPLAFTKKVGDGVWIGLICIHLGIKEDNYIFCDLLAKTNLDVHN